MRRRAQKRFREREKLRKATLESQVAELSSKLSAVMQEKTRLENRNSILEKVGRVHLLTPYACMTCLYRYDHIQTYLCRWSSSKSST